MNESINSDKLSDLLNISMDLSQSPLSIVARDLCPIVGLAHHDELHLTGRNGGLHGSSCAGGVGGRSELCRSQGLMMGDIICARSQGAKYHPIAATICTVSDHTYALALSGPTVTRTASGPTVALANHHAVSRATTPMVVFTLLGPTVARATGHHVDHTYARALSGPTVSCAATPVVARADLHAVSRATARPADHHTVARAAVGPADHTYACALLGPTVSRAATPVVARTDLQAVCRATASPVDHHAVARAAVGPADHTFLALCRVSWLLAGIITGLLAPWLDKRYIRLHALSPTLTMLERVASIVTVKRIVSIATVASIAMV